MGLIKRMSGRYDLVRGWEGTNPGWYELVLHVSNPPETIEKYYDSIEWLKENIHGCEKHCRWMYAGNYLKYKFRYERDYLWFKLVWG